MMENKAKEIELLVDFVKYLYDKVYMVSYDEDEDYDGNTFQVTYDWSLDEVMALVDDYLEEKDNGE